jgi:hypothetical protein
MSLNGCRRRPFPLAFLSLALGGARSRLFF